MIDAALLAGLAPIVGAAAGTAGTLLPSDLDKRNAAELRRLKRKQELGALGLSEAEMDAMYRQEATQRAASQRASDAQRRALLSGQGAGAGASLQQAVLSDEQDAMAAERSAARIAEADAKRAREEEQEIEDRVAAQSERAMEKRASVADLLGAGAMAASETYQTKLLTQGKDIPQGAIEAYAKRSGMSSEEAAGYLNFFSENPHMMDMIK